MLRLLTNRKWHTQHCAAISATAELLLLFLFARLLANVVVLPLVPL